LDQESSGSHATDLELQPGWPDATDENGDREEESKIRREKINLLRKKEI
jgi:hypothetical protein